MNPYDFTVGDSHLVDVTHINHPHNFFVRTINVRDFMDLIEKPDPAEPMSANMINLGQLVVYRSKVLEKYVRGNIRRINIEEQTFDIYAIDYGCLDNSVLLKYIHYPDQGSKPENQCPGLAVQCRLNLCEPKGSHFTEEVIDTMKFFVGKHTATIIVMSKMNEQLAVELRTVDCPRDIATMLGLIHNTIFFKELPSVHRFSNVLPTSSNSHAAQNLNYKHKRLNVGDILHVRVQSGTSLSAFYVAEMNEFKKFISDGSNFSQYCKGRQMKDEDIVPGRICAVKVDEPAKYERAIVKRITEPNKRAVLQLVDWGKEFESHFLWIKSVDSDIYVNKPILAIYCSTDEQQAWKTSLPRFLYPGYDFFIKIMVLGNGFDQPHKVNIFPKSQ